MRKVNLLLGLLISLCCISPTHAETFWHDGIWYSTNDTQTVNVVKPPSGEEAYKGAVEIPAAFSENGRDYSVTGISAYAFAEDENGPHLVKSVRMGNNIKAIEEGAFMNCAKMTGVEISDRTLYLGSHAFYNCSELTSVKLGSELEDIRDYAFTNCESLGTINLPSTLKVIGEGAFGGCHTLSSIVIPDKVTTINRRAFMNAANLSSIKVGISVTSIGEECFNGCESLKSFEFPPLVSEIAASTFYDCSSLREIKFNDKIEKILDSAFNGCSSFTDFVIPSSVTEIGSGAFGKCTQIKNVTFEDSLTPIRYDANNFIESPVESLTLGRTLKYSSNNTGAFSEKDKQTSTLKKVTVTKTVEVLPKDIFKGCKALVNVEISEGLKEIGEYAFESCEGLKELVLPSTVTTIGSNAFAKCYYLSSINIPSKVTVIETQAFYQCRYLTEVDLSNITEVKNGAFSECDRLETIRFSSALGYIQNDAFNTCMALRSITIPENVKSLGSGAFYKAGLNEITTLALNPPSAQSDTWDSGTYERAILNVPSTSNAKYKEAEGWKKFENIKDKFIYSVDVHANEGGEILLNGVSTNHLEIEENASLEIVLQPFSNKIVEAASYTMGSSMQSFKDRITVAKVTADITVNVTFADKPLVPPTSISFPQSEYTVKPGEELRLEVSYQPVDAYSPVTYSVVSGSDIVTISGNVLTGIANGTATVQATTQNGLSATCVVIVDDGTLAIAGLPHVSDIGLYQPYQLSVRGAGDVDPHSIVWTSSDESIIKIFPNGVLMAVDSENRDDLLITITATLPDGRYVTEELDFYIGYSPYPFSFEYMDSKYLSYVAIAPFEVKLYGYINNSEDSPKIIELPEKVVFDNIEYGVTGVDIEDPFITQLISFAVNPPKGHLWLDKEYVTVYVPKESVSVYQASEPWKPYTIKAIGSSVYTVTVNTQGDGHVLLNGVENTSMIIDGGSRLTIEAVADYEGIGVLSGKYTMNGQTYTFTDKAEITNVNGDVTVDVVFGKIGPSSISFPTENVNIWIGETQSLKVSYYPYGSFSPVTYSILSGLEYVSINGDKITGIKAGNAIVQAETENGLTAICYFTVLDNSEPPVTPGIINALFDFTDPTSLSPSQIVNSDNSPVCEVNGTVFSDKNVSLVAEGGGTSPRLWAYGGSFQLRVYNGATMTISTESKECKIKSMVFNGSQLDALNINGVPLENSSEVIYIMPVDDSKVEIKCMTNGGHKRADISSISVEYTDMSGVDNISVDDNDSIIIYNLQGLRINSTLDCLSPGTYVVRHGKVTKKIIVK